MGKRTCKALSLDVHLGKLFPGTFKIHPGIVLVSMLVNLFFFPAKDLARVIVHGHVFTTWSTTQSSQPLLQLLN